MQHIKDNGATNDLSYSESLVLEGHPTHPLTKTKLPLTTEEIRRYAPEFEKLFHYILCSFHHHISSRHQWKMMNSISLIKLFQN